MGKKSIVYVKFPKTGLGNMLLLWARAAVFARLNQLELLTSSWWGFRWGALLRNEQRRRLYWGYFRETSFYKRAKALLYSRTKKVVVEPKVERLDGTLLMKDGLYMFNTIMTDHDIFGSVRDYHQLVTEELYASLTRSKRSQLAKFDTPVIGIHIRRGDFKLGSIITPLSFFIGGINIIRQKVGEDWPVTVFTDAEQDELAELLSLPAIKLAEKKADILDILLLSKSRVLLLSATSTFSYWAAFLSDAFVVRPANDWLALIRNTTAKPGGYFEMKWETGDEMSTALFKENIIQRQLNSGNES